MFKFEFSKKSEDETKEDKIEEIVVQGQEIKVENFSKNLGGNLLRFELNDVDVFYFDHTSILHNVINIDATIQEAEKNHSDLVEGIYEGGLKIWECTYDLANYLCTQNKTLFKGKQALDLGCGSGILGILAYKLGATEVHYQDYNEGVIKHLTMPNIAVNGDQLLEKSRFWCGDWKSFSEINDVRYDIILTSETIYNPKSHRKLLNTLKTLLTQNGVIILGGKSYYFGVGGGMKQFLDLIEKDGALCYENIWKCDTGLKREIILLRRK